MGVPTWQALVDELNTYRSLVTAEFEAIAFRDGQPADDGDLTTRFATLWESGASEAEWHQAFGDEPAMAELAGRIVAFQQSPSTLKIDKVSQGRLQRFVPTLLKLVLDSEDPVLALDRTLVVIEQVLRRSAYVALLNENNVAAQRLVSLCERSAYIAGEN